MAYGYMNVLKRLKEEQEKFEAPVYVVKDEKGKSVNQNRVQLDKKLEPIVAPRREMMANASRARLSSYSNKEEDKKWYQKILQVPEVFKDNTDIAKNLLSDGFQLSDAYKLNKEIGKDTLSTIGGTVGDLGLGVAKGIANVGEGLGDALTYGIAQIHDWTGNDERANQLRRNASVDVINNAFAKPQSYVNKGSIIGDSGDKVSEGIGYMASIWAASTVGGAAGGALAKGSKTTQALNAVDKAAKIKKATDIGSVVGQSGLIFGNSTGTNMADIYQQYGTDGVTSGEAWAKSLGGAAIETLTEQLFGMFGHADTKIVNGLAKRATSSLGKVLTRMGGQAGGEFAEEVISYAGNYVWDRVVDAASKGEGATFAQEWNWEDMWEQAGIAALTALSMGGGQVAGTTVQNKNSNNTWKDAINETARQQDVQANLEILEDEKASLEEELTSKNLTQTDIDEIFTEMQEVDNQINALETQDQIAPINENLTQEQYIRELDALQREYLQAPDTHAQTVLQQQITELQAQAEQQGIDTNAQSFTNTAVEDNTQTRDEQGIVNINKFTGEPTTAETKNVIARLSNNEDVSIDEIMNLPEVKGAYENIDTSLVTANLEGRENIRNDVYTQLEQKGSYTGIDKNGKEVYNGSVEKGKIIDIVIGLPASGKSSVLVNPLSQEHKARVIDSDMAKELLPEFNDGLGAGNVHEESQMIIKDILKQAVEKGENIVYPILGSNYNKLSKQIQYFKSKGYTVNVELNDLPKNKAMGRMLNRFLETGRFIDPAMVAKKGNPSEVYEQLKKEGVLDGYQKYSNDVNYGEKPIKIESSSDNRGDIRERGRHNPSNDGGRTSQEQLNNTPTQEEITNLLDIQKNKSGSEYANAFFALRDKYGQTELYKALNEQYSREKNTQNEVTAQVEKVVSQIEKAIKPIQESVEKLTKKVEDIQENATLKNPEVADQVRQSDMDSLTQEEPPKSFEDTVFEAWENDDTDYSSTESKIESPFDNRDIDEVGNRKVKAYQYENPEVKPYFQTEAENMLYDLDNTIKGEKIAIKDQEGYITDWAGITRQTTEAIAYLKDNYGYSYAQIRQGLNDIIEDNGKENNAVAKRIEFMLDERLREGYTTSDGIPIPPNQEYINFLGEKHITEYNQKISEILATSDQYIPPENIQENSLQNMEGMIEFNNGVSDSNFITVAPYYNTQLTNENFETIKNAVDRDFKAAANKFSSLFGAKIEKVDTNIGGFTFQEGETAGQFVKELSYTFELKNVSAEDSDVIASLLGDLGHEQQEAVISANYLDSTSNEADALEFRIKVNDSAGVEEALSKAGINDYTIDTTDNTIKILEFDIDNPESTIERLKLLVNELGGNYNGTEESKIQSRYLDREARRGLYQRRLATNEANQQNGELNNYISEALRKIEGTTNKELDNSSFSFGEISPTKEIAQDIPMYEKIEPRESVVSPQIEQSNETIPMKRITAENQNTDVTKAKVRKWAETSTESEVLRDEIAFNDLDIEKVMYQPITNKGTLNKANDKLGTLGYDESVKYFNSQIVNKKVSVEDIALGERLIQEAIKQGDKTTAAELIQNVAILGTELGQKVQALSIIQRMTPAGQLKMLDKIINRGKVKEDAAFKGIELTQEMKDKILSVYNEDGTYDQDELNRVIDEVKQQIADNMPVTKMDKINAWRYFSMLGNPKTHIRNLVSNVAMKGTLGVKNAVARTIETIAPIENRTKTWQSSSQEVKDFAKQTTVEMKDIISDGGKYSETADLKARRDTFKNKVLNKLVNFNSDLLEKEDWWFSKGAFESSFSEFLTANGIKTQEDIQNNPELIEKGKLYATEQAQIATFRQYSWLSNKINDIENKNAATQIAVGSILPFKKTPINIAKAGLSYSPIGALKSLTYDLYQVKQGKMEASTAIDHIAQGATGTALTLIGYLLAQAGILNGAGDDDKEGKYDYQLGKQAYSLNIGGNTYSLSWLSPVAMPLFVGANAHDQLVEGEEWNADVVLETLGQTLDPLSEMSFLSSLDSVLSSYETGTQRFFGIGEAMLQNYATQFVPTASSQLAATLDDTKRTTKVSGDSNMKLLEETYNKLIYKIPGLRETLEPTTDIWGNEVKQSENLLKRTFENFISPYARKESIATEIDGELKDLFSETGENGILPNIPYNYVNFDGEKYKMSAEEYTEFKKTYGQTANDLLEDLFRTTTYKTASSEDKVDMVNDVYDYASDLAKKEYLSGEGVSYTNATKDDEKYYKENDIKGAIENDLSVEEYRLYKDDPEEYDFLKGKDISYRRKYFDTNNSLKEIEKSFEDQKEGIDDEDQLDALSSEKKASIVNSIINSGLDDTEKASLYKRYYNSDKVDTIVQSGISIDDFLTYSAMEFKADKKSNGKTISGSRKNKVIDYVNSLELNIPQKAIIIKSTNTFKFNDYNEDIIDYVNNLDISYQEKVDILDEVDIKVDSEGNIYWE